MAEPAPFVSDARVGRIVAGTRAASGADYRQRELSRRPPAAAQPGQRCPRRGRATPPNEFRRRSEGESRQGPDAAGGRRIRRQDQEGSDRAVLLQRRGPAVGAAELSAAGRCANSGRRGRMARRHQRRRAAGRNAARGGQCQNHYHRCGAAKSIRAAVPCHVDGAGADCRADRDAGVVFHGTRQARQGWLRRQQPVRHRVDQGASHPQPHRRGHLQSHAHRSFARHQKRAGAAGVVLALR